MARTMFDNFNAIVADTLTNSIKMIDINELHESEDNFFSMERIEELADTILGQGGVKDNLIVSPLTTGGYEIISGHRRRAAVQYLLDKGENISRYLPCLVQNYADNYSKRIDLVLMNISARQLSDSEIWKSYEMLDEAFKEKKSAGEKFGRLRETIAEKLGVSSAQVGKMQNIDKHAVPAIKEAIEKGDVSISTANELAKLPESEQEEIIESGLDLSSIKSKDIAKKKSDKKVDTNINFELEVPDDIEEEFAEAKKVDTNINFVPDIGSSYEEDFDIDENFDTEKVDTNINFSENSNAESEKEENAESNIADFIRKNYFELNAILTSYTGIATDEEIKLVDKFRKLLTEVKNG